MKIRVAIESDYEWIKAMSQRHKTELGYVAYAAIIDSIKRGEVFVAEDQAGFCRWHKRQDGWHVIYDLASELKGAGRALLLAVPLPRRLKAPIDIEANGFYKHMGGRVQSIDKGKQRPLNIWIWSTEDAS